MEDDFLLDEDDDLYYEDYVDPDEEDSGEDGEESNEEDENQQTPGKSNDEYLGNLTKAEMYLSSAYDDIQESTRLQDGKVSTGGGRMFDVNIVDAVRTVLSASPKNTSTVTVENKVKELFHTQGHNRIPASLYTPDQPLRSGSLSDEFGGNDDSGFNEEYTKEARNQIARFVEYLSTRDLSQDSEQSKNRKLKQLPAFIIFLFSSGLYDLILNCETMPEEYQAQITNAFQKIQKMKLDIVEALAQRYESRDRDKVAERVRRMGISWFDREPNELTSLGAYKDLELDSQDIRDYREFRPRFNNVSRTITQELISDYIEVVVEPGKIYRKLKDKTRAEAIADVKQLYIKWSSEDPVDSELASKIVWKS
jgi:hypothetical protein